MVRINNSQTLNEVREAGGLQLGAENQPIEGSNQVIFTSESNPKLLKAAHIVRSATASTTLYTTPSDRDFYLTNCALSVANGGTDTGTDSAIQVIINGATQKVLFLATIASTAVAVSEAMNFSRPIKVDRGTAISIASSGAYGRIRGSIVGFELEGNG